ncbi:MAG: hypothetical protein EBX50_10580 [Chitinophagia bacterium]|nr:hypothetical protein [Chitinophagia bacterium]
MPESAVDENTFEKWLQDIFGTSDPSEGSFHKSLLDDTELQNLYLDLLDTEKTHLKNRIRKHQDSSFTFSTTAETTETSENLIKAFIRVNNAKAELDKTAEGVKYTEKQGDGTDSYEITLTKEKHTISIPDKETGKLYTAVFQKTGNEYNMTIEITVVNGATKQGGNTDFQEMQKLVKAENHKVTLMVNGKPINLFNQEPTKKGTTKTLKANRLFLEKKIAK